MYEMRLINIRWEEFINSKDRYYFMADTNRELTDIQCPKCGKNIYVRTDIILLSNPPKSQYECECGWVGYN